MKQRKERIHFLTNKFWVIMIAIFCSILWGSAFPVLKISYEEMKMAPEDLSAKIVFAGMRFLLASCLLLITMFFVDRKSLKLTKKQFLSVFGLGLLSTSLQYFFFYNGLAHTSGMKASILVSSGIFFTVLLAHFVYNNDHLDWGKTVGLVTGFAGIVLANWGQNFSLQFSFTGEGFLLMAGLTGAFGTFLAKSLSTSIHPIALTGWQMLFGSVLMLIMGVPKLESDAMAFTPTAVALLIYAALLSAIAFALWFALLKYNKAGEVSIYKFVVPITGTILSALFIPEEYLTMNILGSLMLVAAGIVAVNQKGSRLFLLNKKRKISHQQK